MALKAADQKSESFAKDVLSESSLWAIYGPAGYGLQQLCYQLRRHPVLLVEVPAPVD
jgi:hypothetical protein